MSVDRRRDVESFGAASAEEDKTALVVLRPEGLELVLNRTAQDLEFAGEYVKVLAR